MNRLLSLVLRLLCDRSGNALAEYALVTALLGLACIVGFTAVSKNAAGQYTQNTTGMTNIQTSPLPTCEPSGCP
jgi:Flp pilus assembly pilin Flp